MTTTTTIPEIKPLMRPKEVAAFLNVTPNAVYKWISNGTIPPESIVRIGGGRTIRIKGDAIERMVTTGGEGMSATIFRGTSRQGEYRHVEVTDDGERITLSIWTDTDHYVGGITLDAAMADGLGSHLRHRVLDIRDEQEAVKQ